MRVAPYLRHCAIGLFGLVLLAQAVSAAPLAQAFEVRHFTTNAAANGETDFKGKTEFLSTEQRVDFLRAYAEYGRIFWRDPRLDKEVFPLAEARVRTQQIKQQPRPQVRVRLLEDEWAWQGQPSPKSAKKEMVWSSPDFNLPNSDDEPFLSQTVTRAHRANDAGASCDDKQKAGLRHQTQTGPNHPTL